MRIAILADIHGNHLALQEVLKSARQQKVELLFVLGDVVGYYYYPDKVLDLLSGWDYRLVQGNHEGFVKQILATPEALPAITAKYGRGLEFALAKLDRLTLLNLANLPHALHETIEGITFALCHGSPWHRDQYIYPDAERELVEKCDLKEADFVLMGHTHYPCSFKGSNSFIANPGSVGQSRVKGGVANWAIIDTTNRAYLPQFTPYDVSELAAKVALYDPNLPYLREILYR